jgi:glycosyltransferase involved in cell wall biosynthesis
MTVELPLVSVMMPAYNAGPFIARAIQSLLAQTYTRWELLVVNDGSNDSTGAVAGQFGDPRVRLIEQQNSGEAAARNKALALARGELLAFLDADDLFLPDHLESAVQYLKLHPMYDAVYSDGFYCDQADTKLQRLSEHRIPPVQGRIYEYLVRTSSVFGPPICVVLRRDIIVRNSLSFDPLIVIGPDWDFFIRYSDHAEFGYRAEATCLYRVHQTNVTLRTDSGKRFRDLARCRTKAIRMDSFAACSVETREFVFYDLLINLLGGLPERQAEVVAWPQFRALPAAHQARLLRLAAVDAMRHGVRSTPVDDWLCRSRSLNPADFKGALISVAYRLSPDLSATLIRAKYALFNRAGTFAPLANIGK